MKKFLLPLILLATVVLYASLWSSGPLTWDDDSNIFANPYFTLHMWWGVWTEPYYGLYVPLIGSVWAALLALGQGEAWPFRLLNLSLHAGNVVLVYVLLKGFARRCNVQSPYALALAVGLFALHPLQVEAVAWISGGRDLMSTFFALACTLFYFRTGRARDYVLATTLFVCALLCKPNIVILPLVVLLINWVLNQKWAWAKMAPWLALALLATMATHGAQVGHLDDSVEWWQRPWLMCETYFFYVQKIVWPFPLSANYAWTPEKIVGQMRDAWKVLMLIGLVYFMRPRWLVAVWGLLLLPVSGLVPFAYANISQVADHYAYLPMVAAAAASMMLWEKLWQWRAQAMAWPAVLLVGWTALSCTRLPVWKSDLAFFKDMAQKAPDSYSTAIGMSVVLCQDTKDYAGGLTWTEKAMALRDNDILALANRAFCLMQAGRTKEVVAMDFYLDKLDKDSLAANQPTAYSSLLASIGSAKIQNQDFNEGFQFLCEAYRVKPSEPNHAHNLEAAANILKQQGLPTYCDGPQDDEEE